MRSLVSKLIDIWMDFITDVDPSLYKNMSHRFKTELLKLVIFNILVGWLCSYTYFLFTTQIIFNHIFGYTNSIIYKTGTWIFALPLSVFSTYYTWRVSKKWKLDSHLLLILLPLTLLTVSIIRKRLKEKQAAEIIKEVMES